MSNIDFSAIILAAGKGTRMNSSLPKVLHPVAGLPMIHRVILALRDLNAHEIRVVLGHGSELVQQVVEPLGVACMKQAQQLGTADAVRSANISTLRGLVLIINGDHPLVTAHHLRPILSQFVESKLAAAVVSSRVKRPGELGRIVRHKGDLKTIVEAKDASAETLAIDEINTGIYVVRADILNKYLPQIQNFNAKNEYYLTDLIHLCVEGGEKVSAIVGDHDLAYGVNNQVELAVCTKRIFKRTAEKLMLSGVVMMDPATTYIEDSVEVGSSTVIYPGTFIRGKTRIGRFCVIEPHCFISDCQIEDSVQIRANSYLEKSLIKSKATIGPFARLRPETEIGVEAHVGNFVEMKKTKFGDRAKAGHLTYLGDAEIGEDTNIGCGTITCNYAVDHKKYKTKIGKNVFVGSDSQFVAPVSVGDHAVIGSGSTITKDVPARSLAVSRAGQIIKENYVSAEKKS